MTAQIILSVAALYAVVGAIFGLTFVIFGVGRIDPAAAGSTIGFRLAIFPGVVTLWPLLAWRWATRRGPPRERGPHRPQEIDP